jgi:hypothetical protein
VDVRGGTFRIQVFRIVSPKPEQPGAWKFTARCWLRAASIMTYLNPEEPAIEAARRARAIHGDRGQGEIVWIEYPVDSAPQDSQEEALKRVLEHLAE